MKTLYGMISVLVLSQLLVGCGMSEDSAPVVSEPVGEVRASLQANLKDKTLVLRLETKKIFPSGGNSISVSRDDGLVDAGVMGISLGGVLPPSSEMVSTSLEPAVGSIELGVKYDKGSETRVSLLDTFLRAPVCQSSGSGVQCTSASYMTLPAGLLIVVREAIVELVDLRPVGSPILPFEITTPQQFVAPAHSLFLGVLNGLESDAQSLLEQAAAIKGLKVVETHGLKAINLPSSHADWVTDKNSKVFEVSSDFDPKALENLSSPSEIYFEYEILSESGVLTTNTIRSKKISGTTSLGGVQ